jgi:hypothetical protein
MNDLTILVQGPFFEFGNYNSNKNIEILKKVFPNANILISTWENENKFKLENEEIIFNKDPGFIKDEHVGSSTLGSNILRQIISVENALTKINTKYTLKIRSDCYFESNKILSVNHKLFNRSEAFKIFDERIVISSLGSFNQKKTKILFHFNDWFNYGLTKDLKKIWTSKISKDDINFYKKNPKKKQNIIGRNWDLRYTAEQFIYYKSINNYLKFKLEHSQDFSKEKLNFANKYLINNFYLEDINNIDFCFPKYDPRINSNLSKNSTNLLSKNLIYISYDNKEWKKLYYENSIKYLFHINFNLNKSWFRFKLILKNYLYKLGVKFF